MLRVRNVEVGESASVADSIVLPSLGEFNADWYFYLEYC